MKKEKLFIKNEPSDEDNFDDNFVEYEKISLPTVKAEKGATSTNTNTITNRNSNQLPNQKLINELLSANEENQRLYFNFKKQGERMKQLSDQIFTIETINAELKEQLATLSHDKIEMTNKINNISSELQAANTEIEQLRSKTSEQDGRIKVLVQENNSLRACTNQLRQQTIKQHDENAIQQSIEKPTNKKKRKMNEDVYEVENILNHKLVNNERFYLIRWKNYDPSFDTWEKESDLSCPKILKNYFKNSIKK